MKRKFKKVMYFGRVLKIPKDHYVVASDENGFVFSYDADIYPSETLGHWIIKDVRYARNLDVVMVGHFLNPVKNKWEESKVIYKEDYNFEEDLNAVCQMTIMDECELTPASAAREAGLKNGLADMSRISLQHRKTLENWFRKNRPKFDRLLKLCVLAQHVNFDDVENDVIAKEKNDVQAAGVKLISDKYTIHVTYHGVLLQGSIGRPYAATIELFHEVTYHLPTMQTRVGRTLVSTDTVREKTRSELIKSVKDSCNMKKLYLKNCEVVNE